MLKLRFWHIDKIKIIFILVLIIGYFFIELYREIQIISSTEVNSWTEELSADCAIVLTGGPQRVREGFDLLVNQRVKKLIISGVQDRKSVV